MWRCLPPLVLALALAHPGGLVRGEEQAAFQPGEPLSVRALVARPLPIKNLQSWTLETRGHRGWLYTLAHDPKGLWLATGGLDGTIRLWDPQTGRLQRALVGHDSYIFGLSSSPDGYTLASAGSWDATARLWDLKTGHPLRTLKHKTYVNAVAWSPDGKTLATACGESGIITFWDPANGQQLRSFEYGQPVLSLAWSADSKTLACGLRLLSVRLLEAASAKEVAALKQEGENSFSVAYAPDGKVLAAGGAKDTQLWEAPSGKLLHTLPGPANAVAWSPDGQLLAAATQGKEIRLYEVASGKLIKTIPGNPYRLVWQPDGKAVAADNYASAVTFWDIASGKLLRTLTIGGLFRPSWGPDRSFISAPAGKGLGLWDVNTCKHLHTLEVPITGPVAVSRSGKTLASGGADKTIRLWEAATGKLLHTLTGHEGPVTALAWSPDGKTLASGGRDQTIRLWEGLSGKALASWTKHDDEITALAWTPNSNSLVSASNDRTLRLWNKTGKPLQVMKGGNVFLSVALSPDGKIIAGGQTGTISVWNASSGQQLSILEQGGSPPHINSLAWSADGSFLASGNANHILWIWNMRTGKRLHNLQAMAPVHEVNWSVKSPALASGSSDRCVRLWDGASGKIRATLIVGEGHLMAVSAEGHYRSTPEVESELVYVGQLKYGQETFSLDQFAKKFGWKNSPTQVRLK